MARVLFGPTVVGIRGTIAGLVFSANTSGAFVKQLVIPTVRKTEQLLSKRSAFASIAAAWHGLTPAQRASWDNYATQAYNDKTDQFGQLFSLTGYAWFVSQHIVRHYPTTGVRNNPTLAPPPAPPITFTMTATAPATIGFTLNPADYVAGDLVTVYMQPVPTPTVNYYPNAWREMRWFNPITTPYPATAGPQYAAYFGNMQIGQRIVGQVYRNRQDGRRSTAIQATATVI